MNTTVSNRDHELIYLFLQLAIGYSGEAKHQISDMLRQAESLALDETWICELNDLRQRLVQDRSITGCALRLFDLHAQSRKASLASENLKLC